MSHVLEHLVRPKEFVVQACDNLSNRGLLVIEVPYESAKFVYQFSMYGRFHEPHITFFNKQGLEQFFTLNFSHLLKMEFSGSAGVKIGERDRMINNSLNPSLKDKVYKMLSFSPRLQRGARALYRRLTGQSVIGTKKQIDLTNNTPDDTKVYLRIVLRRI